MSVLIWLVFSNSIFSEARPQIEIKSEVSVSEERTLLLGDVAEITGLSGESAEKIRQFQLGKTPQWGAQQSFSSGFISGLLRQALEGIPAAEKQGMVVKIPPKLMVLNEGQALNAKSIEEKLRAQWEKLCGECRFVVVNLVTPAVPAHLKRQPWSLKLNDNLPRGQIAIPLEIRNPEGPSSLFWVKGQVQVQREVPVTSRAINFGERLAPEDVIFEWRDVTFAYDSSPRREYVIGKKVNRSLRTNEILLSGVLEKDRALKRGDVVRVVVGGENWSVMSNAIAEEDGNVGDTVRVRNEKTRKSMTGTVQGEGEVTLR